MDTIEFYFQRYTILNRHMSLHTHDGWYCLCSLPTIQPNLFVKLQVLVQSDPAVPAVQAGSREDQFSTLHIERRCDIR